MIKKIKLGLLMVVLSLAVGIGSAYAANLTYSDYTDFSIGGYTLTIYPTSYATSLVTTATNVAVVVPTSSTFTIASHNNIGVSVAGGTDASSNSCTGVTNKLTIPGDSAITYTLTPNSGVCSAGGGGGGSYTPPATPAVPATPATPGNVIVGCGNRTTGFSSSSGVSCVGNTSTTPATPATPATPSSNSGLQLTYNLGTATLKNGSKGEPVKELQRLLNKVLNLGLATDGKLGPKTIAVIKTWQKSKGLVADGLVGAKTRAAMKAEAEK